MNHNAQLLIAMSEAQTVLTKLRAHLELGTCRGFTGKAGIYIDTKCEACAVLADEYNNRIDTVERLMMETGEDADRMMC